MTCFVAAIYHGTSYILPSISRRYHCSCTLLYVQTAKQSSFCHIYFVEVLLCCVGAANIPARTGALHLVRLGVFQEHQATPGLLVRVCIFPPEPPCDAYRGAPQSSSRTSNSNSTKSTNSSTLRQCSADVLDTEGKAYTRQEIRQPAGEKQKERTACRRERGNPPAILVSCVFNRGTRQKWIRNEEETKMDGVPETHTLFFFSDGTKQNETKRNETASRQGTRKRSRLLVRLLYSQGVNAAGIIDSECDYTTV